MKLGKVNFRGNDIYITDLRIKKDQRKEGLYYYNIRHTDDDWGEPYSLEHSVLVNHFGSIVAKEEISELNNCSFIELTDEEIALIQEGVATADLEYEGVCNGFFI